MSNSRLDKHNRECRKIASELPKPLRATWLALAYRADADTKVVRGITLTMIELLGRKRADSAASRSKLKRDIPELEKLGLVKVEHNRIGDKNLKNVYYLNFGDVVSAVDWDAEHIASLNDYPPPPDGHRRANGHFDTCECPECEELILDPYFGPINMAPDQPEHGPVAHAGRTDLVSAQDDPWADDLLDP